MKFVRRMGDDYPRAIELVMLFSATPNTPSPWNSRGHRSGFHFLQPKQGTRFAVLRIDYGSVGVDVGMAAPD
jgi:hypothetical protein